MLCSAHGREFFHLFPELSNSGCLPGRAGGTPYGSRTLVELVPRVDGQIDGYITLESEQPIAAQQLFADRELNFLSTVPATIIE